MTVLEEIGSACLPNIHRVIDEGPKLNNTAKENMFPVPTRFTSFRVTVSEQADLWGSERARVSSDESSQEMNNLMGNAEAHLKLESDVAVTGHLW